MWASQLRLAAHCFSSEWERCFLGYSSNLANAKSIAVSTACWHTALPHLGGPDRRVVIMGWQSSRTVPNPMLSAAHVERLEASGRMTPTLRQLVGAQEG